MKKLILWASLLLLLLVASCQKEEPVIPLESIEITPSKLELKVDDEYQLTVKLLPVEATYQDLVWSSSDPKLASVDADGKVTTYLKSGTVTIKAEHKAENSRDVNISATCELTVKASNPDDPENPGEVTPETSLVDGLAFMENEYSVLQYDTINIRKELQVFPTEIASAVTVKFQSSDTSIATVNSKGDVVGVSEGEVLILASANGKEAKCKVYVEAFIAPQSLSLNYTEKEIFLEETLQLRASFTSNYPTYSELDWSSSNAEVASVDDYGLVTTYKYGDAVITATHKAVNAYDKEVSATCTIKVRPITIKSITLNYTSFKFLTDGSTLQLKASTIPENALYSNMEWTSTNPSVAVVSPTGLVTPLSSEGNTTIVCKHKAANEYDQDVVATCSVRVIDPSSFEYVSQSVNGVIFDMVYVEGGTFQMGATPEQEEEAFDNEFPVHTVTLSSYYLSKTEVTQAQYQAIMGENPSTYKDEDFPVFPVNWYKAKAFCDKLSELTGKQYVLPTEAQWEYAARGGKYKENTKYAGSNNLEEISWCYNNPLREPHSVATKVPNALGLYDMTGSVSEWCADWYTDYSAEAQTNPIAPDINHLPWRIYRGGGLNSSDQYLFRVSSRGDALPNYDHEFAGWGFRVAMIP